MKRLARERVPDEGRLHIPRTLWVGADLSDLPELPDDGQWVFKPTADSGVIAFGPMSRDKLIETASAWPRNASGSLGEWAYDQVPFRYLLEERIPAVGDLMDYKFLCFDGEPQFIQVNAHRFGGGPALHLHYGTDLVRPLATVVGHPWGDVDPPARLDDMLQLARELSSGFDFIRVDLYSVGEEIWFGEFTPYPNGGLYRFDPPEHDANLGRPWTLPQLTPDGRQEIKA